MKLLRCGKCHDVISITGDNITRSCKCDRTAGKYLKDQVTAVITERAVVFGIDNNSFLNAYITVNRVNSEEGVEGFEPDKRYDFFFTGWIPTIPGEVIVVKDVLEVMNYDYEEEVNWTSQNPSTDINEKDK